MTVILDTENTDVWAERIRSTLAKSVEAIVETGRSLLECKAALPHGTFEDAVGKAGIAPRVAQMFMAITEHPSLSKASNYSHLPAAYNTLYELSRLEPAKLERAIETSYVLPGTTRAEAKRLLPRPRNRPPVPRSPSPTVDRPEPPAFRDDGTWSDAPEDAGFFCPECSKYYEAQFSHRDCVGELEDLSEVATQAFRDWVVTLEVSVTGPVPLALLGRVPAEVRRQLAHDLMKINTAVTRAIGALRGES